MKNFLIFIFFLICSVTNAQQIETFYVRSKSSTFCGEEKFTITFNGDFFERTDSSDGSKVNGPSRKVDSNYDNSGIYYEIRTPAYMLEAKGVVVYQKYNHFMHRIGYDKKGGNILYVYEINSDKGGDGKFYFTQLGYEKLCN